MIPHLSCSVNYFFCFVFHFLSSLIHPTSHVFFILSSQVAISLFCNSILGGWEPTVRVPLWDERSFHCLYQPSNGVRLWTSPLPAEYLPSNTELCFAISRYAWSNKFIFRGTTQIFVKISGWEGFRLSHTNLIKPRRFFPSKY